MSTKAKVSCPCMFCGGRMVSKYTRHEHSKRFASMNYKRNITKIAENECVGDPEELSGCLASSVSSTPLPATLSPTPSPAPPSPGPASPAPSSPADCASPTPAASRTASSPTYLPDASLPDEISSDNVLSDMKAHDQSENVENFGQHFDIDMYTHGAAITPLYENASLSVLEAVAQHLLWFTNHPGLSKQALSDILYMQHHSILPKNNLLPESYYEALKTVSDYLVNPIVFDVCPNDCIIFRNDYNALEECPKCNAKRYKTTASGNQCPVRTFHYLPLGPRLERLFGTPNLAKLVQAHASHSTSTVMYDIQDSPMWKSVYSDSGLFKGDARGISLSFCTDGVNPFSHLKSTYSMWPMVLSLLNFPRKIRHDFCNMLLVGIIPGNGKKEAFNIHPYLEVLVDELLSLSNSKVYDAYRRAHFEMKVEVLLHVLDYPGIGKVFNVHGAGSYIGCLWCDIKGTYSKVLNKMVYLENRRFLPMSSKLRNNKKDFPSKSKELLPPPNSRTYEEIKINHQAHDGAQTKIQATQIAKSTGCKGMYPFQKLEFHDPVLLTVPDAMHTVKDAIEHFFYLIVGRDDSTKLLAAEAELKRFGIKSSSSASEDVPFKLTKEQKKNADERANLVVCPQHVDFTSSSFFTKANFKSHDWKQIVCLGILKFCLRGFLAKRQRETLFFFLDTMSKMLGESHDETQLDQLQDDMNTALALLERDFPVTKQVMCVHLLHHVVPGLRRFGPVYGTWMYSYERFNSWMTRRVLNRAYPEATIIETYRIFEWCNFLLHSRTCTDDDDAVHVVVSSNGEPGTLQDMYMTKVDCYYKESISNYSHIVSEYNTALSMASNARRKSEFPDRSSWNPVGRLLTNTERLLLQGPSKDVHFYKSLTVQDYKTGRQIVYSTKPSHNSSVKINSSFIRIKDSPMSDVPKFGCIVSLCAHIFTQTTFWAIVDIFSEARYDNDCKLWYVCNYKECMSREIIHIDSLSYPLVVALDTNLWILNY